MMLFLLPLDVALASRVRRGKARVRRGKARVRRGKERGEAGDG